MKKQYIKPTVELMNAKVERGFAGSGTPVPTHGNIESIAYEDAIFFDE